MTCESPEGFRARAKVTVISHGGLPLDPKNRTGDLTFQLAELPER